jgi:hypothetical protein
MTIKLRELRRITKDYAQFFPGWKQLPYGTLARDKDCVLQGIVFNRSSSDDYMPLGYVRVLAVPGTEVHGMELTQDLKYPNGASDRRVKLANHEKERNAIYEEICRQIRPSVLRPLDPEEVLTIYEREAAPNMTQACSLAALNACLGHSDKAVEWVYRYRQLAEKMRPKMRPWSEWMESEYRFVETLAGWLEKGIAQQELQGVVTAERVRFGIASGK